MTKNKPDLRIVTDAPSPEFPDDPVTGWDMGLTVDQDWPDEPPEQYYERADDVMYDKVMVGPGKLDFYQICCWFNSRIPDGYVVVGTPFKSRTYWAIRLRREKK